MESSFDIDSYYTLVVNGQYRSGPNEPTACHDLSKSVSLQVVTHPEGPTPGSKGPDKVVFFAILPPSYARAIASAILSAATEARG